VIHITDLLSKLISLGSLAGSQLRVLVYGLSAVMDEELSIEQKLHHEFLLHSAFQFAQVVIYFLCFLL